MELRLYPITSLRSHPASRQTLDRLYTFPLPQPLPRLFHLLDAHLLPTTVSLYHSDEFEFFKGPNSTSFITHFVFLCLESFHTPPLSFQVPFTAGSGAWVLCPSLSAP